ncbi:penicillin-binding transpeptidase domain-containing protein [Paenibacillus sp. JX-17]|uniref:Penicillin-binding transpeptidase domain-containing protein n=1 Tax=Paenibacillus lacisoli TaxID=3064525 RepID=A0ABT9CHJ8_9BACL|nr:penicillin-binding transpeptidase domain-containing protein [Paenibacillus sp. JX-17]MDO7907078.1 penicillin-binding transpeptidase domain-containing protein [Paenibacillus sp. JX-17]
MRKSNAEQEKDNDLAGRRRFTFRINLFFFSSFIIFTVIIVRLAILQFVEGPQLKQEESSSVTKSVPLPPIRGTIYDASGTAKLAYSTPVQSLYITLTKNYSKQLEDQRKPEQKLMPEMQAMAAKLEAAFNKYGNPNAEKLTASQIIDEMDLNYTKSNGFTPRRLKMDLSEQEIAYFMAHKEEFPGVEVVEENIRHYDPDTVAVQTIGYIRKYKGARTSLGKYKNIEANMVKAGVNQDPGLVYQENEDVGFDGLELQYQDALRGKNGYKTVPVDPRNMPQGVESITPPQKGYDIYSTINKNVQVKTEQAIMDQLKWLHTNRVSGQTHPNATTGYAVAMEVNTGNVVAMASMPDYDSNVWQSGSVGADDFKQIANVYQNGTIRPFSSGRPGQHPESVLLLGSTIKPLSVLLGLEEGLFTTSTYYHDNGTAYFGRNDSSRVRNSGGHAYGTLDPSAAIRHSSNTFMVDMVGERLYNKYKNMPEQGIDVWDRYMKEFGLGVSTGVDLPNEYLGKLEYTNKNETALSRLAYASFGQQGKYTTLQLAQYVTMLANHGQRLQPHLVSQIKDDKGNVVQAMKPKVLNEAKFPESYWNEVIKGMATDVEAFRGFPYDFARKTGTSQQSVGGVLKDNGVFIAFAPRENPKLAVAVVVPEGGFGAWSAGPIARKIFDAYDEEYGLDGVPKKNKDNAEGQADTTTNH